MADRLKSNHMLTGNIAKRIKGGAENPISTVYLSGKTNLKFRTNLQSICEEAKSVLEAYLEACRLNGEAIETLGDSFEEIDSGYLEKLK